MNYPNLDRILANVYGVGILAADPTTVLWAMDRLPVDQAKAELKALNARRHQMGRPLVYVPYGHPCF